MSILHRRKKIDLRRKTGVSSIGSWKEISSLDNDELKVLAGGQGVEWSDRFTVLSELNNKRKGM